MARKPTQQQVIDDLLNRYDPIIAQAFRQAVEDVRGSADLQRLIAALAAGDLNAALNALNLEAAAYGPLSEAIRQAYGEAGTASAAIANGQTPAGVVIRFNIRNPRAETWLRDHSSQAVTRIVEDQRNAIRAALQAGMERGVTADMEYAGVQFKAKDRLVFLPHVYGLDAQMVEDPMRVDFDRPVSSHLVFGSGPHRCVGSHLARLEMKIVLEEFAKRYPKMRLREPDEAKHMHTFVFRAPSALPVVLQ